MANDDSASVNPLAPGAPVVITPANGSVTNDSTPTYSGTVEAGATVSITVDGAVLANATVTGTTWTFTQTAPLAEGLHTVTARATDAGGDTGPDSNTNAFIVDTTPPAAPVVSTPGNGSVTSNSTPTCSGTAEPGSTVTIIVDGTVAGTTTADAAGNWSLTSTTPLVDGPHTVRARATDAVGNTSVDSNTNTFTVATAIVANNDNYTLAEDSAATVLDVLANDATPSPPLTVTAVTQSANATVTLSGGVVRFAPGPDFTGTTNFTYTISDVGGGTSTATVAVTVTPVNDPPAAQNDIFTVTQNSGATALDVLANDTSAPDQGETLTITAVTQPANGTVNLTSNVLRFTPAINFTGTTNFTYTISDGNGGTGTAQVTVTVAGASATNAVDDNLTVAEDSGATAVNVLANDSTPTAPLTVTAVTQPANGTVDLLGGEVFFIPAPNFFGTTNFTYTVRDGSGGTDVATVTVMVMPVNDPPDAVDDTLVVAEDSGATPVDVLANDSTAPDTGETLTVSAVTQPAGGMVSLNGGVVRFTPASDFSGTTVFTYTASDGNGGTDTATVTVTVVPASNAPTALNDSFTVADDSGATALNVLANDVAVSGQLIITAVTQPANGTVNLSGGVVRFTPAPNFLGSTSFMYTVTDGSGETDTATVTVSVILECID